jgi:hypothetical protein
MDELDARVRAICDLNVAEAREYGGRHEYDGVPQDLSADGVATGLARLAAARESAGAQDDPHDEAHLRAFEKLQRVVYADLELQRSNPIFHLGELDLACYDKDYAPEADRHAARAAHLAAWPTVIDVAVATLDAIPAPIAGSLLGAVRGLAAGIPADADPGARAAALSAHTRLVAHVQRAADAGPPDAALGAEALAALLSSAESIDIDLAALAARADAERDRLMERFAESAAQIDGKRPPLELARELVKDHPDRAGVIKAARDLTERAIAFTRERDLVPVHDGVCLVGESPESRRWAMAMISINAPAERDAPSWYWITPPDESWPHEQAQEWLEVFSASTLPAITVHEVAPGHFSHHQALRRARGDVRRTLFSSAFVEGWAHYAEELCIEEGFLADDPRFAFGVWLEALVRVTRLACALGVHTAGMTVQQAAARFEADTHLTGPAALSEASRATFDPTYGHYTWGKLEILALRERAKSAWGAGFSLKRFHTALMDLGSPPLGLIGTAVEQG